MWHSMYKGPLLQGPSSLPPQQELPVQLPDPSEELKWLCPVTAILCPSPPNEQRTNREIISLRKWSGRLSLNKFRKKISHSYFQVVHASDNESCLQHSCAIHTLSKINVQVLQVPSECFHEGHVVCSILARQSKVVCSTVHRHWLGPGVCQLFGNAVLVSLKMQITLSSVSG